MILVGCRNNQCQEDAYCWTLIIHLASLISLPLSLRMNEEGSEVKDVHLVSNSLVLFGTKHRRIENRPKNFGFVFYFVEFIHRLDDSKTVRKKKLETASFVIMIKNTCPTLVANSKNCFGSHFHSRSDDEPSEYFFKQMLFSTISNEKTDSVHCSILNHLSTFYFTLCLHHDTFQ